MKYLLIMILGAGGYVAFMQPDLLTKIPIPQDPVYEQKLVQKFQKYCNNNIKTVVQNFVANKGELSPQQYEALLKNPNFQSAFCDCQVDILLHERMLPSGYLPKEIKKPITRKLASTMKSHLNSPSGSKQINYCYIHAWTRASFSN